MGGLLGTTLSTPTEVHAFVHGMYASFKSVRPRAPELPENGDVQAEPHYFKGGWLVGTGLHLLILAVVFGGIR